MSWLPSTETDGSNRVSVSMTSMGQNNLGRYRQIRGMSAADLALRVGVTRQTIYSMEAGDYVPNTAVALKLGRVLGASVEELFWLEDDAPFSYPSEPVVLLQGDDGTYEGRPVQLCRVGSQLVASCPEPMTWSLPPADGVLVDTPKAIRSKGKRLVQPFADHKALGKRLLVAGCDPGITVLARHLQRAGIELIVVNRNSTKALELLKAGLVHIAGTHLRDEATGVSNLPAVHRFFDKRAVAVIGFAIWEEGVVVARGNPKGVCSIEDFLRKDVRIVNREPGAGCRIMLDKALDKMGVDPSQVDGYDQISFGHLPAAWQVQTGKADACIATRAAARVFGLDFVPLIRERYDLVLRRQHLSLPEVQELLDTLGRASFRRELEGLGGYDTTTAGNRYA